MQDKLSDISSQLKEMLEKLEVIVSELQDVSDKSKECGWANMAHTCAQHSRTMLKGTLETVDKIVSLIEEEKRCPYCASDNIHKELSGQLICSSCGCAKG
jgi:hypothetical protein